MSDISWQEERYRYLLPLFESRWLEKCSFAAEFREQWKNVLRNAARKDQDYSPADPDAIYAIPHIFQDVAFTFHFDQLKLADWFRQDSLGKEHRIFLPRELKRNLDGEVGMRDSALRWEADAPEPVVPEEGKEILVCALPGFPPPLRVVYGNRHVDKSFYGFKARKLSIHLIRAEHVPAFLCSSFEVCVYLFWMDCCIMMENRPKLKDKDLKPLLHIFRPSSMLTVKELK